MGATFDSFIRAMREPDSTILSPGAVAAALDLQLVDLAISAGVHRNTLLLLRVADIAVGFRYR